jgi:hypothetical protein
MPVAVTHLRAQPNTGERLVVRLDPAALGSIQVDIRAAADGGRDIRIAVEKPATLALLHQDRHALETALGRAGIATESGQIRLDLARPGLFQDRPASQDRADAVPQRGTDLSGGGAGGDPGTSQQGGRHSDSRPAPRLAWLAERPGARTAPLPGALDITA